MVPLEHVGDSILWGKSIQTVSGANCHFDDETIVDLGNACSRMGPLHDSTLFTLDD